MHRQLGPLELVAGEWIVGDPSGRQSRYLKLQGQGISCWVGGTETEVIPWSRFMNLHLSVQPSRLGNSKVLAKVTDIALALTGILRIGGGEAYLAATLRHPYEDWSADFTHAARKYDRREIHLAEEFFKQVVESGRATRLGDPQWVTEMVEKIASLPPSPRNAKAAVGEIVRS